MWREEEWGVRYIQQLFGNYIYEEIDYDGVKYIYWKVLQQLQFFYFLV